MNDLDYRREAVNLTNCDLEPIHAPGTILPHGAMLVVDPDTLIVLQAGGETASLLGVTNVDLLGVSMLTLFSAGQIDNLKTLTSHFPLVKPRHLLDP